MNRTIVYIYGQYKYKDKYYANDKIPEIKIGETTADISVPKETAAINRINSQVHTGMPYTMRLFDVFEFPECPHTDDKIRKLIDDNYEEIETSKNINANSVDMDDPYFIKAGNEWVYNINRDKIFTVVSSHIGALLSTYDTAKLEKLQKYAIANMDKTCLGYEETKVKVADTKQFYLKVYSEIEPLITSLCGSDCRSHANKDCIQWKTVNKSIPKVKFHFEIIRRNNKLVICLHRETRDEYNILMKQLYNYAENHAEFYKIDKSWWHGRNAESNAEAGGEIQCTQQITKDNYKEIITRFVTELNTIIEDYFNKENQ